VNIFLSRDEMGARRFSVLARTPLLAVAIRLTLLVFDPFPIQQCFRTGTFTYFRQEQSATVFAAE
jgi:hypothetical protein